MERTAASTRILDNYIAGEWTPAGGEERLDVTNPEVQAHVRTCISTMTT
jgi:hypothetical protein